MKKMTDVLCTVCLDLSANSVACSGCRGVRMPGTVLKITPNAP
jgi:hypothetical protein